MKQFCSCQSSSTLDDGRRHNVLRLSMEQHEQYTKSYLNSCVVLSRTVQPENGNFRLNLRFVSPWNTDSPQQFIRRHTKKLQNLPGCFGICFDIQKSRKSRSRNYLLINICYYQISYFVTHKYFHLWLQLHSVNQCTPILLIMKGNV